MLSPPQKKNMYLFLLFSTALAVHVQWIETSPEIHLSVVFETELPLWAWPIKLAFPYISDDTIQDVLFFPDAKIFPYDYEVRVNEAICTFMATPGCETAFHVHRIKAGWRRELAVGPQNDYYYYEMQPLETPPFEEHMNNDIICKPDAGLKQDLPLYASNMRSMGMFLFEKYLKTRSCKLEQMIEAYGHREYSSSHKANFLTHMLMEEAYDAHGSSRERDQDIIYHLINGMEMESLKTHIQRI